jgi:catechol 2,3-dioxygenase
MSTASAPIEIGRVALTVNDLATVRAFYEQAIGLVRLGASGEATQLGAGDRVLLELREDRSARRSSSREAGLFHTAFLLPSRAALGRWLRHAVDKQAPLQGASDHLVSEAIYLADPEGNGIEVYRDRPREEWTHDGPSIRMATEPLDLKGLAEAADGPWTQAPEGTVVGHVHLQVGSVHEAEEFYCGTLGFDIAACYPGATFLGSGGYHHHVGANVWNSRGAGRRRYPSTGLADVELLADRAALQPIMDRTGGTTLTDPWGASVTLTSKGS